MSWDTATSSRAPPASVHCIKSGHTISLSFLLGKDNNHNNSRTHNANHDEYPYLPSFVCKESLSILKHKALERHIKVEKITNWLIQIEVSICEQSRNKSASSELWVLASSESWLPDHVLGVDPTHLLQCARAYDCTRHSGQHLLSWLVEKQKIIVSV